MCKIVVVGSLSMDFVVTSDKRPTKGETVIGKSFETTFGGKGANQAVAAARLGANVKMVGKVGSDLFGDSILENLKKNSVLSANIERVTHLPTGSAHITLADSDNSIIVVSGANSKVDKAQIDSIKQLLMDSDIVMVQAEIPIQTIEYLINLCCEVSTKIIFNPAPAYSVSEDIISKVTYITPNESEFEVIFKGLTISQAIEKYPNKLIVTLGSKGVIFNEGTKEMLIKAYEVDPVDTTGAGDTFNAGFAVAISSGLSVEDSLKFGNLASSISIQKFGAQGGMPTIKELKESIHYEKAWNLK